MTYLVHLIQQEQRQGYGDDIKPHTALEDVPEGEDAGVTRVDVAVAEAVVADEMEQNVDLGQVGMLGDVEIT